MRLIVTGTRDTFANAWYKPGKAKVDAVLDCMHKQFGISVLIEGGANGVDSLARRWGGRRGLPRLTMHAPWDALGKRAGPVRNGWMITETMAEACLHFPGGNGTADMVKQARAANLLMFDAREVYRSLCH